jgi:hypothetical protein
LLQVWTEEGEEESEMTCSERLQAELQAGVNCIDGLGSTCVQFSLWRMRSMEYSINYKYLEASGTRFLDLKKKCDILSLDKKYPQFFKHSRRTYID